MTNGSVSGPSGPLSGSLQALSGTVSSSGAVSASLVAAVNGCAVNFTGRLATSTTSGVAGAAGTGTYVLVPSLTCRTATGTWTMSRK